MRYLYSFLILVLLPFYGYSQCSAPPVINQGFNELSVCSTSPDKYTYLYFSYANQQPVDSLSIGLLRYTDESRTTTTGAMAPKYFQGQSAMIDLNSINLGFGLIADVIAVNDCGQSNMVSVEIPVSIPFTTDKCTPDYQTQILGNTQIDLEDNSPQAYVLDSPELTEYLQINQADSNGVQLNWFLQQYEGGSYSKWVYAGTKNGALADSTVVFDSIPPGKSYIIFQAYNACLCNQSSSQSNYVLDTIFIEKLQLGVQETKIAGNVYGTNGSDCIAVENTIKHQVIKINPIGQYAVSDENGNYTAYVDSGAYNVMLYGQKGEACQVGGVDVVVDHGESAEVNLFQKFTETDISISSWARGTGQRDEYRQYIVIQNNGKYFKGNLSCDVLQIGGSDPVKLDTAYPAASAISNLNVTWDSVETGYGNAYHFGISGSLENVNMGDTIHSVVTYSTADSTFSLNVFCIVRNSYDPNDKQVNKSEIDGEDKSDVEAYLQYRIRFQNTGNDTAFKIVVTDTIDARLDMTTFDMGSSSHSYDFDISDNNTIVWTFNNIMLPDSGTNQAASNGYLLFRIKPIQSLEVGDEIKNKANIFFDLNDPIITNEAITTVVDKSTGITELADANYQLFPNPVRDILNIRSEQILSSVSIYTLDGSILSNSEVDRKTFSIDVKNLEPGIYFVLFKTEDGSQFSRKFIK